ncbi:hypothetical protein JXA47_08910 [Candidatus Sumerlaeota bacterium]|nr:hypothetical protein [Candidatus Sumerlaeota bacterium]
MPTPDEPSDIPAEPGRARWPLLILGAMVVGGIVFRVHLFLTGRFGFDSDQAISGIGALRILREGDLRIFMAGQHWNGDLLALYLAPLHLIFDPSPALMRLAMLPWAVMIWLTTYLCGRALFRSERWALCAAALMIFPASMMTNWTTRPSANYEMVLIAIGVVAILLVRLSSGLLDEGWSRGNLIRGFALGFTLGFSFWCSFSMLSTFLAVAFTLLLFPSVLWRFAGFSLCGSEAVRGPLVHAVSHFVQAGFLISALAMTHILLIHSGDVRIGPVEIGLDHLRKPAALAGLFLALRLLLSALSLGGPLRSHLAPLVLFAGLWLGALPVIIHNMGEGHEIFFQREGVVSDLSTVLAQLWSVFERGIPILLGFRHDHLWPVTGIPLAVRAATLGLGYLALAVMIVRWAVVRVRGMSPMALGLTFVVMQGVMTIGLFSISSVGWVIDNPRYIMPVAWVIAMAMGCLVDLLSRIHRALGRLGVALVAATIAFNIGTCLDKSPREGYDWWGITRDDHRLLDFLRERGIDRVSCRFDPEGYWSSYRLTYIADEEILFAPQEEPMGRNNRSERYQREVDGAESPAYLFTTARESAAMGLYLVVSREVSLEYEEIGTYHLFHGLEPDVLHDMTRDEYIADNPHFE